MTVFAIGIIVAVTGAVQVFSTTRGGDATGPITMTTPPTMTRPNHDATLTVTVEVTVTGPVHSPDQPTFEQPGTQTIAVASDTGNTGPAVISMAGGVLVALIGGTASVWAARTQRQPQPPPWVMIPPQSNWAPQPPPPAGVGPTPWPQPGGYPPPARGPTSPQTTPPPLGTGGAPPTGFGDGNPPTADRRTPQN